MTTHVPFYTVSGGRLLADGEPVPYRPSPNIGGPCRPRFLIHHFTSGGFSGSVDWLCRPEAKASAHLVVDEDGSVVQLVPFDRAAWHAGKSAWADVTSGSVNPVSIGIEIANLGDLDGSPGRWMSDGGRPVPDDRVLVARHAAGGAARPWHTYPPRQVAAVIGISRALHAAYRFEAVLGHDDVAPGRKVDPGPAWPMDMVRAAVMTPDRAPIFMPPAPPQPAAEAPVPTVVETPRDVQRALVALGYGPLAVDGVIGPASEAAVTRFQRVAGLIPDGDPGPKTRAALAAAMPAKG